MVMVVAITALAFGLRLINLSHSDLTFDESASILIARKPLAEMIPYLLSAFHEHPPAYYVLLSGWIQIAGQSEAMLRFLSVVMGTLSIPLMYRWVREAIGSAAGMLAALILSVTPFHVYYSQDARMYPMIGALALLSWWLLLRLQKHDRPKEWLGLAACGLIGLVTHYYMALVIASQFVYLVLTWRQSKHLIRKWLLWLGTPIALGALYILIAPGVRGTVAGMFAKGLGARLSVGALRSLAADLIFGPQGNLGINVWSVILLIVLVGLGLALSGRAGTRRSVGTMLLSAIFVPLIAVMLIPEAMSARYVIFLIFPIILALTVVILSPLSMRWCGSRRWAITLPMTLIAAAALIGLNVSRLPDHYNALKSDYGRLMTFFHDNYRAGDGVIFNGPWQAVMQVYYPVGNVPYVYMPPQTPPALDPAATEPQLAAFLRKYQRLWVFPVETAEADPDRFVAAWLNQHAYHGLERSNVALYYAPPTHDFAILPKPIQFGSALELSAARVSTSTLAAGEAVLVTLNWQALQPVASDLQVTLEAIDPTGNVWGQRLYRPGERFVSADQWATDQPVIDRQAVVLDPGAPPGDYRLRVSVQRVSSGDMLPPSNRSDPVFLMLASLRVIAPTQVIADKLLPGKPVNAQMGDGLKLISYQTPSEEFVQGGVIPITLYWRALSGPRDVKVDVALVDDASKMIDVSKGPLGPAWYPASQWQPQQVVATSTALRVPPHLAPGVYHLQVTTRDSADNVLKTTGLIDQPGFLWLWTNHVQSERDAWPLGLITVEARERNFTVPAMQHALSIKFGDQIQLLGYDFDTTAARSGGQLQVTFYWQALDSLDQNYVVFTHLMDSSNQQRGQKDSMPVGGLNPTTFWQAGEVVADTYTIDIDPSSPPGDYQLDFGWYQSDTGGRLAAVGADGTHYRDDIAILPGLSISEH